MISLQESKGAGGTWLLITKWLGDKKERGVETWQTTLIAEMSNRLKSSPLILFYCKIQNRHATAATELMDGFPCVHPAPRLPEKPDLR